MTENIKVFTHSSICIEGKQKIYIDPFQLTIQPHDADYILLTHDHHDHYSPEDIARIIKEDTNFVAPESIKDAVMGTVQAGGQLHTVTPGTALDFDGFSLEAVPAYNNLKPFHPKKAGFVGYILIIDGVRIYIAGDTDVTKENQEISCDIALVPIGGTYTMDAKKAAQLVNAIRPRIAIPTHYGSIVGRKEDVEVFKAHVDPEITVEVKIP